MNKGEAIQELQSQARHHCGEIECYKDGCKKSVELSRAINIISKIDELQKAVVPKFVADKIKYCKESSGYSLFHAMDYCFNFKDTAEWLEINEETFALAFIYGYETEPEKLYTVEIPNPNRDGKGNAKFRLEKLGDKVYLVKRKSKDVYQNKDSQNLTEAEIKQDFEWAWDAGFAKEVKYELED